MQKSFCFQEYSKFYPLFADLPQKNEIPAKVDVLLPRFQRRTKVVGTSRRNYAALCDITKIWFPELFFLAHNFC